MARHVSRDALIETISNNDIDIDDFHCHFENLSITTWLELDDYASALMAEAYHHGNVEAIKYIISASCAHIERCTIDAMKKIIGEYGNYIEHIICSVLENPEESKHFIGIGFDGIKKETDQYKEEELNRKEGFYFRGLEEGTIQAVAAMLNYDVDLLKEAAKPYYVREEKRPDPIGLMGLSDLMER